ncbi:MAG: hypothetical protein Q7O66_20475 [Dehalococcoidia bacterium]|nr:hypothetical protein [Dehalococcoidia bacterium]
MHNPLSSPAEYQAFIYELKQRYPIILNSTLVYVPAGTLFGRLEGALVFKGAIILCVKEFINLELGVIEGYAY